MGAGFLTIPGGIYALIVRALLMSTQELPFLEYDLHRRLLNKVYVCGMNAVFGLKVQVSVGDTAITGLAVRFTVIRTCTYTCRLMRRHIKVADPRIFLIYAAYMHIRDEVVDEYHYEHTAVCNVPGIRVVLDC